MCIRDRIKREKSIRENIKEFKLKNNRIYRVYDYYEYLIDDKDFPQHLNDLIDSDTHSFSDIHIGNIGPYGYFWDRINIMFLLRIKLEKERFLQEAFVIQYLKTVRKEYQHETIETIIEKSKNSNVSLYETFGDENYPVNVAIEINEACLLYTSPSPRDATLSRMPSAA